MENRKLSLSMVATLLASPAIAQDRGDYAYVCNMKSSGGTVGSVVGVLSLGWMDLPREATPCRVRIEDASSTNFYVSPRGNGCDIAFSAQWLPRWRVEFSPQDVCSGW
jgi:hypothetical protein